MNALHRKRLAGLGFSPEVVARTEEVLQLWEVEDLFAKCSYCGKDCYAPDLPRGKYRRKKLPAELFWNRELLGFRDREGAVICWWCDEIQFQ